MSTEESRLIGSVNNSQEGIGTRYTHSIAVGHYNYPIAQSEYYGYFSNQYMHDYGQGIDTLTTGSMSPDTYSGYTINHLVYQVSSNSVTMRLLPIHSSSNLHPKLTIDGVTCNLVGPSMYSAYDSFECGSNLPIKVGQTIHIDIN